MLSSLFNPVIKHRRSKKILLDLWREMNVNLERFYVIDQRQFISSAFLLDSWGVAKHSASVNFSAEVLDYASVLEQFNSAYEDMQIFEKSYLSSIANKTRANALILHAKKEFLDDMVRQIKPRILLAQQALRPLLDLK